MINRLHKTNVNMAILGIGIDASLTFLVFFILDKFCEQNILPMLTEDGGQCFPPWSYATVSIIWLTSLLISAAYDPKRIYKVVDEFQTAFLSVVLSFLMFSGFLFLSGRQVPQKLFLLFVAIDLLIMFCWRIGLRIYNLTHRRDERSKNILIVGAGKSGKLIANAINQKENSSLCIVGYLDDVVNETNNGLPVLGTTDEIRKVVKNLAIDEVIFALSLEQYERVIQLVFKVDDFPVRVRIIPDYFNFTYHRTKVENFMGIPLVGLRDPSLNEVQLLFKRIFDIVLAIISLLLLWPFFLAIGAAIKLDSSGPIIFRQIRIGENGRKFQMFKFRSMIHHKSKLDKDICEANRFEEKDADDPRITRVGRILRRTSLDELPQLFNILRGEMSFVGPRPEVPWRVVGYEPWQRARFSVPQGLTGWWQVNGRANNPMHLNTRYDLYYIENYSFWLDLEILIKTPLVVLRGTGAF